MGDTQYANKGSASVAVQVFPTDLTIELDDVSTLPVITGNQYFYLVLELIDLSVFEVVKVTDVTGTTLTVQRAQGGTTAEAFPVGSRAENRVTKSTLDEFLQKGSDPTLPVGGVQYDMLLKQSANQDDAAWVSSLDSGLYA